MTVFPKLVSTTALTCLPSILNAMALMAAPDATTCAAAFLTEQTQIEHLHTSAPRAAAQRLPNSRVTRGQRDIAWAWLASPTARYPHTSMGSVLHAGSLHALTPNGQLFSLNLPKQRVFEDLQARLVDLDRDGCDEIVVVEADTERGAALVAYGLPSRASEGLALQERARSKWIGLPFRWLNPVGFSDFDNDGQVDLASVTTPHIGGVLTLYRYKPPQIEAFAKAMDVSNHQMGDPNLQMHAILSLPGQRPVVIVPDMSRLALHALRWDGTHTSGQWRELAEVKSLPGRVTHLMPLHASSACAMLADRSWWRIDLK